MASSVVSMGTLMQSRASGTALAEGSALAADGSPTIDPRAASIPLPLGGPKGSGLALMAECLASLLTANPILAEALERTPAGARHKQNGLVIAIDVARFVAPERFKEEVGRLVSALKRLPAADGAEILMPGERGSRNAERQREALPIPAKLYEELKALAE
jgi:ureidoglycolate dehydrogenase (NAD+)